MWLPVAVVALQAAGEYEAAATVSGKADVRRFASLIAPDLQFAVTLDSIRGSLGAKQFDECVARGRGMSDDALAGFVVAGLDQIARAPTG